MARSKSEVSLGTVAARSGVSRMTVSRVLRHDTRVAAATRDAVLKAAREAGYVSHGAAPRGRVGQVNEYAILCHRDYAGSDAYFGEIIRAVQQELFARNCACSLAILGDDMADFVQLRTMLLSRGTAGILIVGAITPVFVNALIGIQSRLMLLDDEGSLAIRHPYNAVYPDHLRGGRLAFAHLLGLGRRRIAVIEGQPNHYFWRSVRTAWREAMEDAGIPADSSLVISNAFNRRGGYRSVNSLLASGVKFDAVFTNDEMAVGALDALREAGLRVPRDVSVMGFDGLPIGEDVSPRLSTVKVDRRRMVTVGVERLMAMDARASGAGEKTVLLPELVVRESCGGTECADAIPVTASAGCRGNKHKLEKDNGIPSKKTE
ncbi:MAG: LacI family DNA-binding transcriptional regulator [Kiritimatiellae bacterium]|nr:LacI family DNA-binding transcriptional regulator [Kiritimatiellia bacterium]